MKLRQGELPLIDNTGDPKFPAFLYDEDAMDSSLTQGLFRGPLLLAVSPNHVHTKQEGRRLTISIQVYRRIFISPTAATGGKASSKRGNAKIHGMEEVLPSTICYTAIHVRVCLLVLGLGLTLLFL